MLFGEPVVTPAERPGARRGAVRRDGEPFKALPLSRCFPDAEQHLLKEVLPTFALKFGNFGGPCLFADASDMLE